MVLVEESLEYEINEKGERTVVRSLEATRRVNLRFRNMTQHVVAVVWRDYQGRRKVYGMLPPWAWLNVDTYTTHPWMFEDSVTKERYVIKNKSIFYPPTNQPLNQRTLWNITIGVRTLKRTALLAVSLLIRDPNHSSELGLPASLADELRSTLEMFQVQVVRSISER